MLSAVTVSGTTMFPAVILARFGLSVGTVGITLWCRDLSSDEEYPERVKLSQTLFSLGGLVASPVPGVIADATGSYSLAYLALAIIQIVIFVVIQVLYKKNSIKEMAF